MKDIIEQLEIFAENIQYDIQQDWNENKSLNTIQLLRLEQAIDLLKRIGDNNNITD